MNPLPIIDLNATGQNIMRLRRKAGITVKMIQKALGFSTPQAIYKWQNGTAMPTVDNLVALAAILGVTLAIIKPITGKAVPGSCERIGDCFTILPYEKEGPQTYTHRTDRCQQDI